MTRGTGGALVVTGLASAVRRARADLGFTQAELARRAGITPSYVSRIEGAAWEKGGPWPSDEVLRALARVLGCSSTQLIEMRRAARDSGVASGPAPTWSRRIGAARYGVSLGPEDVHRAAQRLLERNPPRGSVRLTSQLFDLGLDRHPSGAHFAATLGRRMAEDTAAILYRMCVARPGDVERIRVTTEQLAVGRDPSTIHNIRTRCCFTPPAMLDVVVGEHEALIAVPDRRGHPLPRACLVIDDPDLVGALKDWYDDFIWEPAGGYVDLRYDHLDEALANVEARLSDHGDSETAP